MEVDWGGNTDPNDTSSRCMLKEVDWGAHETHQNEHSTTKVHWGGHDPGINAMDGYSISEVDVHIDPDANPKNFFTKEMGLNYVEGKLVHHLALKKCLNRLDHQWDQQWDPTQGVDHLLPSTDPDLCPSPCLSLIIIFLLVVKKMGRDLTSTSLMEYLKYSFDTENESSNPKSIKQYRSPYSLHDLQQHESSYNLLNQWDPRRNFCNLNTSGKQ